MYERHATQQHVTERTVAPLPVRLCRQCVSALMQTLVTVLLTALLLVLLTDCSTGPTGPSPPPSRGWKLVSSPNPGLALNGLNAVTAISASDIWAVGTFSTNGSVGQTLVTHWNGTQWSVVPSPSPGSIQNVLLGVAAVSAKDLWTVGYFSNSAGGPDSFFTGSRTLIGHWNGTQWSVVPSPSVGSMVNVLNGVAIVSANDIWAVGTFADSPFTRYTPTSGHTLTLHWNGTQWSIVKSPDTRSTKNVLLG